jgi:hypothetical protein
MISQSDFIQNTKLYFEQSGYIAKSDPVFPGIRGLLYAYSQHSFRLGAAKVQDFFLFVDWDNAMFGRKQNLVDTYQSFRRYVNKNFPVPHLMRMSIPSLGMVAISSNGFPDDVIGFVQSTYFNPWYGGEFGQIFLIDIKKEETFYHPAPRFRSYGSLPLQHGLEILRNAYQTGLIKDG